VNEGGIRNVAALLQLGSGVRTTDWMQYPCPFAKHKHASGQDRKPSFGIRVTEHGSSHYYCFTCKKSGNLSYLPVDLASYGSTKQREKAVETMVHIIELETQNGFPDWDAANSGEEPELEPLSEADYGDIFPPAWEDAAAREYLAKRGVSQDAAAYMGIGYDPEDARVVFPVRGAGKELYGYTGRTVLKEQDWPRTRQYAKSKDYLGLPKKRTLLNHHNVTEATRRIVVVEGPMDTAVAQSHLLAAKAATTWAVVGVLGSTLSKYQIAALVDHGLPVYLFLDDDEAGTLGLYGDDRRKGAVQKLKAEVPVYVPCYPQGSLATDVGDLSRRDFLAALKSAQVEL
jgi:DNA primase